MALIKWAIVWIYRSQNFTPRTLLCGISDKVKHNNKFWKLWNWFWCSFPSPWLWSSSSTTAWETFTSLCRKQFDRTMRSLWFGYFGTMQIQKKPRPNGILFRSSPTNKSNYRRFFNVNYRMLTRNRDIACHIDHMNINRKNDEHNIKASIRVYSQFLDDSYQYVFRSDSPNIKLVATKVFQRSREQKGRYVSWKLLNVYCNLSTYQQLARLVLLVLVALSAMHS